MLSGVSDLQGTDQRWRGRQRLSSESHARSPGSKDRTTTRYDDGRKDPAPWPGQTPKKTLVNGP